MIFEIILIKLISFIILFSIRIKYLNKICMKKVIYFFIVFVFALLSNTSYSQKNDSLYILEPEKYIANKIFTHRITMLGEGIQHNHPITYLNLNNILNIWLDRIKNDETLNSNLTIILEFDSTTVSLMDNYVKKGEIRPLLDLVAPNFPLELLEQLYEYRKIYKNIEKDNIKRKQKINLSLKGFEEIGGCIKGNESYFNQSQRENELWFINERDKYTSEGIIKYLKENPDQKAIIFYGSGHLQAGIVNKNIWGPPTFSLSAEESMGKWIAQFLVDEFGEKEINIIVSVGLDYKFLSDTPFENIKEGETFLLKKPYEKFSYLKLNGINQYLVNQYINIPLHNINFALSRFIIEKSIEQVGQFEKLTGYKAGTGRVPLYYLNSILRTDFKTSEEIKKWYEGGRFKGFDTFDSSFSDKLSNFAIQNFVNFYYQSQLPQIGFYPPVSEYLAKNWKKEIWPEVLSNIKFINAVEIFWVGYPDEQEKAKKFLKEFSGKDFDEPALYLQWWRKEYCKFEI